MPADAKVLYTSSYEGYFSRFAKKADGGFFYETTHENGFKMVFETDSSATHSLFYGDFNADFIRFGLWLAFALAILPTLTVPIHASSILYKGKVILFLGESGTGKSTHSRLWLKNIEGSELFNDDSPFLKVENGKIIAYGTPWSGKTPCYRNESYPVAACVRLSQAPYNKITRLSVPAAYAALHPSCPPDFAYDERLYDYVSEFLGYVVAEVPVYHLDALPDAAAAFLSHDSVFA